MLGKLLLLFLLQSPHHQAARNPQYRLFILKKYVWWQVSWDAVQGFRV